MSKLVTEIKGRLAHAPLAFSVASSVYRTAMAVRREAAALFTVAPRVLARRLSGASKAWQDALPVQAPLRIPFEWPESSFSADSLKELCEKRGLPVFSGHDAVYLPPRTWAQTALAFLQDKYPANCGLKIARRSGSSEQPYLRPRKGRSVQRWLSFPHTKQTLTFNFLYLQKVAPRLFDLIELAAPDGELWTAYVVEHAAGRKPDNETYDKVVGRLKALEAEDLIRLVNPEAWNVDDFRKPDCAGNLLLSQDGRGVYVDIHNFILHRYDKYLHEMGKSAAATSHFGGRSFVLGGRDGHYLYQEIPGVALPAKRSPADRMKIYDRMMESCGLDFRDKVIFDIGCNMGLMGAEYLRRQAAWLHGWDLPEMVSATERVLLAIGCTRFSLTPARLSKTTDLTRDLPPHLKAIAPERGLVNYLAIRGHVGWLDALGRLPWKYMLYEGHQDDTGLDGYIQQLAQIVPVKVAAAERVCDAHSRPRDVAIIERLT